MNSGPTFHEPDQGPDQARRDEFTLDPKAVEPAIWTCKIGSAPRGLLPPSSDSPMRRAVSEAYERLMGFPPDYVFSGWGDALSEGQQAFIDERQPDVAKLEAEALDRLRCLPPWSTLRQHAERRSSGCATSSAGSCPRLPPI
jgi:hypothetical protein